MLVIGIIGRIRPVSEMIVTSNHIVIGWGCTRQAKIVLIYHSARHSKTLSSNLCGIEARIQAKFTTRAPWLLLHALIDFLLRINTELIVVLVANEVSASTLRGDTLTRGRLTGSFATPFFNTLTIVALAHRHCSLHHLLLTGCSLDVVCSLGYHDVRIFYDKIVAWAHIEL